MRKRFDAQIGLGETAVEEVTIPLNSRDELPPILAGLQWMFKTQEIHVQIFELLENQVVGDKQETGRPGMDLWHIFVLGVIRLGLGCDYDRLEHIANHDNLVRQIMGLPRFDVGKQFHHRTISQNVCQIDAKLVEKVNDIVVLHGRKVLSGKEQAPKIEAKTDSFVLETNVHYPTDCNLLWDASRKCVELLSSLYENRNLGGWRKSAFWKKQIKMAKRACERIISKGGPNKAERMRKAAQSYLTKTYVLEEKINESVIELNGQPLGILELNTLTEIKHFHEMLIKHIDLVDRRLVKEETIAHEEKVFSLFEPHTELIKKGKTMPPVEFGHRFLVTTDQYQLVIDYKVMEGGSEGAEIVPVVDRLLYRFGEDSLASLSTDKGFSSKEDRELLELFIDDVMMPKKGKKNAEDTERERAPRWLKLKDKHSEVESNINSLEQHGLDRCPDKGLHGYKRYAGLGVLAYNLHRIGKGLLEQAAGSKTRGRKKKAA